MKKLFYILFVSATFLLSTTSCTEEEVKPNSDMNGGGAVNEPVSKG